MAKRLFRIAAGREPVLEWLRGFDKEIEEWLVRSTLTFPVEWSSGRLRDPPSHSLRRFIVIIA